MQQVIEIAKRCVKRNTIGFFLGKTEAFLNDALIEVRKYSQKILPTLEKSVSKLFIQNQTLEPEEETALWDP